MERQPRSWPQTSLKPRQNETESSAHRFAHGGEKAPGLHPALSILHTPHLCHPSCPRPGLSQMGHCSLSPAFGIQIVASSVKPSVTGQQAFRALCITSRLSYRRSTLHCSPPPLPCPRGGDITSLGAPAPSPSGAWMPVPQQVF